MRYITDGTDNLYAFSDTEWRRYLETWVDSGKQVYPGGEGEHGTHVSRVIDVEGMTFGRAEALLEVLNVQEDV